MAHTTQTIDMISVSRDEWDALQSTRRQVKRHNAWKSIKRFLLWLVGIVVGLFVLLAILGATLASPSNTTDTHPHGTPLDRCNTAMVAANLSTDLCEPLTYPGGVMPNPPVICDKSGLFCIVKLPDGSEYLFDTDAGKVTFIHQH